MTIVILEKVPAKLRGELSRWLLEPRTGVFVGKVSALVRDRLWDRVVELCGEARAKNARKQHGAVLIYRARTEQGFAVRIHGDPSREMIDVEGLVLVRIPRAPERDGPPPREDSAG